MMFIIQSHFMVPDKELYSYSTGTFMYGNVYIVSLSEKEISNEQPLIIQTKPKEWAMNVCIYFKFTFLFRKVIEEEASHAQKRG